MSRLQLRERAAEGEPRGLLVLHHGRGADEADLLSLSEALDPERELHVAAPRAPLVLPGWPGYHWYQVPRVGYPDPATFLASLESLAALHDELWERTGVGPERTVLGGFSMGAVMSYASSLSADRPVPAGVMAFSGFVPTVAGWEPALAGRGGLAGFVAHGTADQVISVQFARAARELLQSAGAQLTYREGAQGHWIEPADVAAARDWLGRLLL